MKTDVTKLKTGDRLSRISFMEVQKVLPGGVQVVNEEDFSWTIGEGIVAEECYSVNYVLEQAVTKTELAETLMNARDAIVKVVFDKADGTERTLVGYVIGAEVVLGRTIAIDLEKPREIKKNKDGEEYDTRQRLVDHRTLKSLIYKNVKYVLKGKK
jgi:hypothetical protein